MTAMRRSSISDQKRLVRKMQWEHARGLLRVRDKVHHASWRVLTIAGPSPHEEINCVRELMHHAHITSVDIDPTNIEAAIEAGADEVHVLDVLAFEERQVESQWAGNAPSLRYEPSQALGEAFDIICLDLTGPANDALKRACEVYFREPMLAKAGAMIVTFSYGRDVVEVYQYEWERLDRTNMYRQLEPKLTLQMIPNVVAARVWYLLRGKIAQLDRVVQYRGGMMPMVSCLLRKGPRPGSVKFLSLEDGDYELAVEHHEDASKLFACPIERVLELRKRDRRQIAAAKAVETRRLRATKEPQLRLIEKPKPIAALVPVETDTSGYQQGSHIDSMPTFEHDESCGCPKCAYKRNAPTRGVPNG